MSEELNKLARAMRDMSDMVGDHHWMAAKAIEDLVKNEGEIAKRDARIVELESGQSADMFLTLTGEITQLRAELAAIKAPARDITAAVDAAMIEMANISPPMRRNECERLIRAALNGAPVRQVSVPDERAAFEAMCDRKGYIKTRHLMSDDYKDPTLQKMWESWQARALLAAAPAAPAAGAGLVEALKQALPLFDEDGLNELYHHCEIAVLGDRKRLHKLLAAHSAKGMV